MNEKIRSIIEQSKDHEGEDSAGRRTDEAEKAETRRKVKDAAKKAILEWWKETQQAIYIDTDSIKEVKEDCSIEEAIFKTFTGDSYH